MKKRKEKLYKIGEVAKMFNISISSLRHYEKIGLLSPEFVDEESGYRYYGIKQFERLNIIKYLRVLDFPVKSVLDFLQNRDVEKIKNKLLEQKQIIIQKKKELEIIEQKINKRLNDIEKAIKSKTDVIETEIIPKMKIAYVLNNISPVSHLDLETSLRQLDKGKNDPIIFSGKVGVGISEKNLKAENYSEYGIVFVILDEEDVFNGNIEILPKQHCLTLKFRGTHKDAYKYYEKMIAYIKGQNLEIIGFSREITMVDYSLSNNEEQFITEIQIPIKKAGT